ncbi:organic solute transporter subunit beta [Loxodonta africana]|uniref:SLC51 subunit beta n=1 Tax=Loxodonta africana TaxID=9785 RepID=G3TZN4_LOXAF|nr:organic solute transporter subunit beta [Loxodonta africana]XP_049761245.1 organic solute transporter subunit beta [Elephas maximus indicus]XP_049761246.1 organic solute transporter subunit beta [Elephas maximus indicus]
MDHGEGAARAPAGTAVPQELLEEMLWFFRVEDASPWNYAILTLASMVIVISTILLGRSIQANRNRKKLLLEKQTPEVLYLSEARNKDDNSTDILRETLLSEKPHLTQVKIEFKDRDVPLVLTPDLPDS